MTLTLGVGLFPTEPVPAMVELARLAETLGFGHVWIGDSHLIWREAYVTLTAAALATTRVVLGTGVTNLVTHEPAVVASAFATLHEAMPGLWLVWRAARTDAPAPPSAKLSQPTPQPGKPTDRAA